MEEALKDSPVSLLGTHTPHLKVETSLQTHKRNSRRLTQIAGSGCPQGLKICGPPDEPSCCKYCPHVKNC
ncbi:hypothetical protein H4Q26_007464 [Puccinia striiformis f. sp. tritici PST-130]|nr:hypothetical protein H4Q26_007464 [Puccinia striiformis f. sp. tritici PST-130]